jgi:hypothetical protein
VLDELVPDELRVIVAAMWKMIRRDCKKITVLREGNERALAAYRLAIGRAAMRTVGQIGSSRRSQWGHSPAWVSGTFERCAKVQMKAAMLEADSEVRELPANIKAVLRTRGKLASRVALLEALLAQGFVRPELANATAGALEEMAGRAASLAAGLRGKCNG